LYIKILSALLLAAAWSFITVAAVRSLVFGLILLYISKEKFHCPLLSVTGGTVPLKG